MNGYGLSGRINWSWDVWTGKGKNRRGYGGGGYTLPVRTVVAEKMEKGYIGVELDFLAQLLAILKSKCPSFEVHLAWDAKPFERTEITDFNRDKLYWFLKKYYEDVEGI